MKRWPFFRTLLSSLDRVLATSDLHIAARYVELVEDRALGRRVFAQIRAEWLRVERLQRGIHLSINGIAAGLRNAG